MKMFKKLAAVIMAAAVSTVMLTACSGGGGTSITLVTPKDCTEYTFKTKRVDDASDTRFETTDGKLYYSRYYSKGSNGIVRFRDISNSMSYGILYDGQSNDISSVNSSTLEKEPTPTITTGTEKYNEKSYTTKIYKTIENGGEVTETYLFEGATLKYYKVTLAKGGESRTEIYEVQVFNPTADMDTLNNTKEAVEKWLQENRES